MEVYNFETDLQEMGSKTTKQSRIRELPQVSCGFVSDFHAESRTDQANELDRLHALTWTKQSIL